MGGWGWESRWDARQPTTVRDAIREDGNNVAEALKRQIGNEWRRNGKFALSKKDTCQMAERWVELDCVHHYPYHSTGWSLSLAPPACNLFTIKFSLLSLLSSLSSAAQCYNHCPCPIVLCFTFICCCSFLRPAIKCTHIHTHTHTQAPSYIQREGDPASTSHTYVHEFFANWGNNNVKAFVLC